MIFRSPVVKPVVVGTAFLGFSEKFIALLKSVDDVAIELFKLGLTLHSLVFKRKESIDYALENIVPGITTSSGSSKINAVSQGASFNAAINCSLLRFLMSR